MNDLGWTLAWLTVQVSLLLAPVLGLHALAERRGRAVGSGIAAWGLGLVIILDLAAFAPVGRWITRADRPPVPGPSRWEPNRIQIPPATATLASLATGQTLPVFNWRRIWDQVGREASGSVARAQPWGWLIAVVMLGGLGLALGRLGVGLVAIRLWRRRGVPVADEGLIRLVDQLRAAMRCRRVVAVLTVADLTTPATAGWFRPLILLPPHWETWTDAEHRAVLAHEIAHIVRGDYAASLLARLAVALNAANPLVRLVAARLTMEQELAADALGARFAGGPTTYLVALSGLLIRQDNHRFSHWPARAFLPVRQTLSRRIAMLRTETLVSESRPNRYRPARLAFMLGLLALMLGVGSVHGPAWADADAPAQPAESAPDVAIALSFDPVHVPESATAVFAFHPAAATRHAALNRLLGQLTAEIAQECDQMARELQIDPSQPTFRRLDSAAIESIVMASELAQNPALPRPDGKPTKTLHSTRQLALTVRMVAPFDWLGFLRQWKVGIEEIRDGGRVSYKLEVPRSLPAAHHASAYLPDDRTLVIGLPEPIEALVRRATPTAPTFLRGTDWQEASRGLLAIAINNTGNAFARQYDLGRPDDALVLQVFQGVDRWLLGLADADQLALHGKVTARDPAAAEAVASAIGRLVMLGKEATGATPAEDERTQVAKRLVQRFLVNLKVGKPKGGSVDIVASGFGTMTELVNAHLFQFEPADQPPPAKP